MLFHNVTCYNNSLPGILIANVNHELIANIKYLLALVAEVPNFELAKILVISGDFQGLWINAHNVCMICMTLTKYQT